MSDPRPTIVLVHGAFAESASWNSVIAALRSRAFDVVAVANPLRGIDVDAAAVRDATAGIDRPLVLVGHSYGGMVITEAAAGDDRVVGLTYVSAFTPDHGESAGELAGKFPGSTLGPTLVAHPLTAGGVELTIAQEKFHHQFAADVPAETAALMAVTQRPITEVALSAGLPTDTPAWRTIPAHFVFGSADLNIPAEAIRFMAARAGARSSEEIPGGSHALSVSQPEAVAQAILRAAEPA